MNDAAHPEYQVHSHTLASQLDPSDTLRLEPACERYLTISWIEDQSSHPCRGSHCAVFQLYRTNPSFRRKAICMHSPVHQPHCKCAVHLLHACLQLPAGFSSLIACLEPSQSSRLIWLRCPPQTVYADLDLRPRLSNALPYNDTIAKQMGWQTKASSNSGAHLFDLQSQSWQFGCPGGPTMIASTSGYSFLQTEDEHLRTYCASKALTGNLRGPLNQELPGLRWSSRQRGRRRV